MTTRRNSRAERTRKVLYAVAVEAPLKALLYLCCACCTCSLHPFRYAYCATGRHMERQREAKRREMRSEIPLPLDTRCRRRLSLPLEGKDGHEGGRVGWGLKRQSTAGQERSRLLTLPVEIRAMIWTYAVGRTIVAVRPGVWRRQPSWLEKRTWKKVGGHGDKVKRLGFKEMMQLSAPQQSDWEREGDEGFKVLQIRRVWKPRNVLLLTCRQMYVQRRPIKL